MADRLENLVLTVSAGSDGDEEADAFLARRLRQQLADLDAVSNVEPVRSGALPQGAKGDAVSLAALAVAVAPAAMTAVLNMLQAWLSRHDRATLTIESGGQKLTITGTPSKTQQELVARFLKSGETGKS